MNETSRTSDMAFSAQSKPWTWKDKLRCKLFPRKDHLLEWPEMNHPGGDCLSIRNTVHLSFPDRIRVMFSGKMIVSTKTTTQNRIGDNKTNSIAFPDL